jgi:hypothetical protein
MLVAGVAGLGLAPGLAAKAADRPNVDGKTSWSESIMVVYLSDDLKTCISYRISRFPDLNDTWVWCTVIAGGRMYAYTDQYLPCAPHHNQPPDDVAVYDAPGVEAKITRMGPASQLQKVAFTANLGGHAGTEPHEGPGPVRINIDGVFTPEHMHPQMQRGRFERIGRIEATLKVGGKTYRISGVGKQHEQVQMAPRFAQSFTYCDLWNDKASLLGLLTARISGGDFLIGDQSQAVSKFAVTKPGLKRSIVLTLADGAALSGFAEAGVIFGIPVYDQVWRGAMVAVTIGGQRMVGMLNDWKPGEQPYTPG